MICKWWIDDIVREYLKTVSDDTIIVDFEININKTEIVVINVVYPW